MKKLLHLWLLLAVIAVMTSCSDNDEPDLPDAKAKYENVAKMLYDSSTKAPRFAASSTPGVYVVAADNGNAAKGFVERVIGENWNGKSATVSLDSYGSIKIEADSSLLSEGIYGRIMVNVTGYTPFTLMILDSERANEDNGYTGTGTAITNVDDYD